MLGNRFLRSNSDMSHEADCIAEHCYAMKSGGEDSNQNNQPAQAQQLVRSSHHESLLNANAGDAPQHLSVAPCAGTISRVNAASNVEKLKDRKQCSNNINGESHMSHQSFNLYFGCPIQTGTNQVKDVTCTSFSTMNVTHINEGTQRNYSPEESLCAGKEMHKPEPSPVRSKFSSSKHNLRWRLTQWHPNNLENTQPGGGPQKSPWIHHTLPIPIPHSDTCDRQTSQKPMASTEIASPNCDTKKKKRSTYARKRDVPPFSVHESLSRTDLPRALHFVPPKETTIGVFKFALPVTGSKTRKRKRSNTTDKARTPPADSSLKNESDKGRRRKKIRKVVLPAKQENNGFSTPRAAVETFRVGKMTFGLNQMETKQNTEALRQRTKKAQKTKTNAKAEERTHMTRSRRKQQVPKQNNATTEIVDQKCGQQLTDVKQPSPQTNGQVVRTKSVGQGVDDVDFFSAFYGDDVTFQNTDEPASSGITQQTADQYAAESSSEDSFLFSDSNSEDCLEGCWDRRFQWQCHTPIGQMMGITDPQHSPMRSAPIDPMDRDECIGYAFTCNASEGDPLFEKRKECRITEEQAQKERDLAPTFENTFSIDSGAAVWMQ